ncbi:MAG: addiction module toxin, HicA family [Chloroflexi bacterium]|nr:MAG: addiction module toxin, HicA family [Chloroflexota bacterium]
MSVRKGSHAQLKHPSRGGRVMVPLHAGETIGPGHFHSILARAGPPSRSPSRAQEHIREARGRPLLYSFKNLCVSQLNS